MITIEHTDTFGGEANYCWAKRWHSFRKLTDLQAVRLAKSLCGLSGCRCHSEDWGDVIALYPAGICQVIFVGWQDDDLPPFGKPATQDDDRVSSCETGPFAVSSI
jgi:hypothetical protein